MIYYQDQYTETQLHIWAQRAQEAQLTVRSLVQQEMAANARGNAALGCEIAEQIKKLDWAGNFLQYLSRWQYYMKNSLVLLCANSTQLDMANNCKEFSFVVYNRKASDLGNFEINKPAPEAYAYNGGLINHGTAELPNWSSHT
jgi:hypothetical protein